MPCGRPWEQPCGPGRGGEVGAGGLCRRSAEHPLRVPGHLGLPPPPAPPNVPRTGPPAPPCRGGPEAQAGDPARRPFPDRPLDTPPARPTSLVGKPRPGAEGVPGGAGGGRAESGSLPAAPHAQLEAPSANVNGGVARAARPGPPTQPPARGAGAATAASVRPDRAPGRTPRPPGAGSRQRRLGSTVSSDPSPGAPVCTQLPLPGDCPSSYRDARIPQAQAGVRLFPEAHPDSLPHHQPGLGEAHARKATQVLFTHGSLSRQGPRFSASSHPPQRPVQVWAAPQGARDAEVRPSASCSPTPVHRSQDGGAGGPGTAGVSPRTAARGSTRGTGKAHTGTETPIPDGPRLCS